MTGERPEDLPPAQRRRLIAGAVMRSVLVAAVLVVLDYVLPLDRPWDSDTAVRLLIGLLVVAAVMVWGARIIAGSRHPMGCQNRPHTRWWAVRRPSGPRMPAQVQKSSGPSGPSPAMPDQKVTTVTCWPCWVPSASPMRL